MTGSERRGGRLGAGRRVARGDEAIADPRNGRDPLAASRRRAEDLAERRDLDGEVAFLDRGARPGRVHQLGLRPHLSGEPQEGGEEQGASLSDGDRLAIPEERSGVGTEQETDRRRGAARASREYSRFGRIRGHFGVASIPERPLRAHSGSGSIKGRCPDRRPRRHEMDTRIFRHQSGGPTAKLGDRPRLSKQADGGRLLRGAHSKRWPVLEDCGSHRHGRVRPRVDRPLAELMPGRGRDAAIDIAAAASRLPELPTASAAGPVRRAARPAGRGSAAAARAVRDARSAEGQAFANRGAPTSDRRQPR